MTIPPGARSLPVQLPPVEYPGDDFVRKVQQGGWVSFQGKALRTSKALAGQPVALRPLVGKDGVFALYFCHQFVEEFDLRNAGQTIPGLLPMSSHVVTYVSGLYTPVGVFAPVSALDGRQAASMPDFGGVALTTPRPPLRARGRRGCGPASQRGFGTGFRRYQGALRFAWWTLW